MVSVRHRIEEMAELKGSAVSDVYKWIWSRVNPLNKPISYLFLRRFVAYSQNLLDREGF